MGKKKIVQWGSSQSLQTFGTENSGRITIATSLSSCVVVVKEYDSHLRRTSPNPAMSPSLTLRALVSTEDAGLITGKAELRNRTGINSEVISGVHEHVLTVTGPVDAVAKAFTELASADLPSPSNSDHASVRLLIPHKLMGTIIGRQGLKINTLQDTSGARIIATKSMLPESTERIVDVQGTPKAIELAIEEIGKCLLEDWEKGLDTVLFIPSNNHDDWEAIKRAGKSHSSSNYSDSRRQNGDGGRSQKPGRRQKLSRSQKLGGSHKPDRSQKPGRSQKPPLGSPSGPIASEPASNLHTQNISIASDMVGCIIGRKGTKITEIRRLSGSKISIAKTPHDETGERMFTITGTPESNEKALFLLYHQIDSEKERRGGQDVQPQTEAQE